MQYLEAPIYKHLDKKSLFLAGGITNCPDWQSYIVENCKELDIYFLNPRRKNFPVNNLQEAPIQIEWEYFYLKAADYILFWFPKETLCPITLFEYGRWTFTDKKLFVGAHKEYKRKLDIAYQTKLARPEIQIRDNLKELILDLHNFFPKKQE